MKKIIYILFIALFTSCHAFDSFSDKDGIQANEKVQSVKESIDNATKNITNSSDIITTSNSDISKANNYILAKATDIGNTANTIKDKAPNVTSEANSIKKNSDDIIVLSNKITELTKLNDKNIVIIAQQTDIIKQNSLTLDEAKLNIDQINKKNEELQKQLVEANSAKSKLLFEKLMWLVIIGVIVLALSITACINGNSRAIGGVVASAVLIITSLAISYFAASLAFMGFVAVGIIFVVIGYIAYNKYITAKALSQTIETTEVIKNLIPTDIKAKVFDQGTGAATVIQDRTTEDLVLAERKKLKPKFEKVINH